MPAPLAPRLNPDLAHVETWIFDLDNTLYSASTNLFGQIDIRMKAFIGKMLGLSLDEAFALQKAYYRQHGTTLRGLMLNHDINPDDFLEFVHDIDHSVLSADPALDAVLARLPGRKIIYTNGSTRHAESVMNKLGIARHFEGIFDIRCGNYVPKPDPAPYAQMLVAHGIDPKRAAMFEDSYHNLKPAADLGMVTVWIKHLEHIPGHGDDLSHCRYVTDDLIAWLTKTALVADKA